MVHPHIGRQTQLLVTEIQHVYIEHRVRAIGRARTQIFDDVVSRIFGACHRAIGVHQAVDRIAVRRARVIRPVFHLVGVAVFDRQQTGQAGGAAVDGVIAALAPNVVASSAGFDHVIAVTCVDPISHRG